MLPMPNGVWITAKRVFIPVSALSAPLDLQLGLRWRMGVRNSAHTLAKLATPFAEQDVLRIASVSHPEYVGRVASFFRQIGARGLLMHGTEGEAYANPQRCPQIHYIVNGEQQSVAGASGAGAHAGAAGSQGCRKPPLAGLSVAWRGTWRSRWRSNARSPAACWPPVKSTPWNRDLNVYAGA
jgi:hypothetical protein